MKTYVIKNKEGKFWQFLYNDESEFVDEIYNAFFHYSREVAEKDIDLWGLKDCKVVEVTIVEGDLEQELNKYKSLYIENEKVVDHQHEKLAKKDKEIDTLNRALVRVSNEKANIIQREQIDYLSFAKEIRKQVCDEIRNAFKKQFRDGMCGGIFEQVVPIDCFNSILDQIEKEKNNEIQN